MSSSLDNSKALNRLLESNTITITPTNTNISNPNLIKPPVNIMNNNNQQTQPLNPPTSSNNNRRTQFKFHMNNYILKLCIFFLIVCIILLILFSYTLSLLFKSKYNEDMMNRETKLFMSRYTCKTAQCYKAL